MCSCATEVNDVYTLGYNDTTYNVYTNHKLINVHTYIHQNQHSDQNESNAGADASVEAPKLYDMKLYVLDLHLSSY